MLGAIIGDIAGSTYEFHNARNPDFELFPEESFFTDDSILTVAIADAILSKRPYGECIREYGLRYPDAGYGNKFRNWLMQDDYKPYYSFGNGSAMRVSPAGWAFNTLEMVMEEAEKTAFPTHNHPEGIKGAQAVAAAIFLARTGSSKEDIKKSIEIHTGYDLSRSFDEIRLKYRYNEICQQTVPESITCFLESLDFEDALRKAIWLGGDSDTIACIAGSIAEAFYGEIPSTMVQLAENTLDDNLLSVVKEFYRFLA